MTSNALYYPISNETKKLVNKYNVSCFYAQHLHKLREFKVVLILDDSTSMKQKLTTSGQTKWDELRFTSQIIVEILLSLKVECDIVFLNRTGIKNIQRISDLRSRFSIPPKGDTPLTDCFNMILRKNHVELVGSRKLLTIIFTDGCPTSNNLAETFAIDEFKRVLKQRTPMNRIFVSIVACTNDASSLEYLNKWDTKIKNLDVIDDYESEKREILAQHKKLNEFSFGDYIAKILLGSFTKSIDNLDEKQCTIL
jgi:hypothetical protein